MYEIAVSVLNNGAYKKQRYYVSVLMDVFYLDFEYEQIRTSPISFGKGEKAIKLAKKMYLKYTEVNGEVLVNVPTIDVIKVACGPKPRSRCFHYIKYVDSWMHKQQLNNYIAFEKEKLLI